MTLYYYSTEYPKDDEDLDEFFRYDTHVYEDKSNWTGDLYWITEKIAEYVYYNHDGWEWWKQKNGWCNFPVAIFYTETAHPEGSNYFGLYRTDFGDIMITNGISATEPFNALLVDGDVVYSRYRHDYREHKGAIVDGGRDYFKHNGVGQTVMLHVVGDHLEVME